ncbi:MAG: hypothetical protein KY476_09235 [Planctomycetes bacterium]|nr:hypothetical protein [Planctomycetota bacterium]
MPNATQDKRKQVYVSRVIQGRLVRRFMVMWCAYHVVLWHAMFLYRYLQYRGELLAGGSPQTFVDLYADFVMRHYSVIICAIAVLPFVLWDIIRTMHRVAGPLVRFQHALKGLARGEKIPPVTLRKHDMLIEFQQSFNEYLEATGQLAGAAGTPTTAPITAGADPAQDADSDDTQGRSLLAELREVRASVGGFGTADEVEESSPAPIGR